MDCIKFKVNGVEHTVGSDVCSDMMLLDYLRNYLQLRGTKYMCREGGCGACMVTASRSPGAPQCSVNSCLTSITSCHGWDIRTIEGLGNKKDGYHTLQTTLAENNATQCGYCTPGWIMTMHGLMESNKNMTMLEIEKSLSSNICRCTGYRPILDSLKKFAIDCPKEDRIMNVKDVACKSSSNCCQSSSNVKEDGWCMVRPDDYHEEMITIELQDGKTWYRPTSLEEVKKLLKEIVENGKSYMLVGGNTSKGAYPIKEYPQALIDVNHLPELKVNQLDQNCIIGAGLPMTDLMDIFKARATEENFSYFTTLYDHVEMVAHIPLRNVGTIAGNLMIKHTYNAYQSDLYLIFDTVCAELTIMDYHGNLEIVTMSKFLELNMNGKIIVNVLFPPLNPKYHRLYTYKLMPRAQSTHAIVNFGFLVKLSDSNVVEDVRIRYGALSAAFDSAVSTERYLIGRSLFTNETLQGALRVLEAEMIVEAHPPEPSVEYRRYIVKALFYKALLTLCPKLAARNESAIVDLRRTRPCSSGKQTYSTDKSLWPFNEPMPKLEATIQCSGEAQYTDDIPTFHNEVYAAFCLSTIGKGTIAKIDPSEALALDGVIDFLTWKDIPGLNSFTPVGSGVTVTNEVVLSEGTIDYNGQPYAIIVAKTQNLADRASKLVKVKYTNVTKPVIDINEAKKDSTRNTLFIAVDATNPGTDTVHKKIKGNYNLQGQYHFPMETVVSAARVTEGTLEVFMSSQWLDGPHMAIAEALNIDQNKIDLYIKRVGGSYGLKITRSIQSAVACSLVAHKLNRPCRLIQPLVTNMKALGKRMPTVHDYEVAVNKSGVIQYLNIDNYTDNGCKVNEPVIGYGYDVYHNVYDITKINYKANNTVTDTTKHTFCRSPGTLEAIAVVETLIERIANELCIDPITVRQNNLDRNKCGEIVELLDAIKTSSDYTSRLAAVNSFNTQNRWKKRALRFSFCRWAPVGGLYDDVNMSVYHADGSVIITHGGVEMGQGLNTKVAQTAAHLLKIPLDKIEIKSNNTIISPNAFVTGGSVTTDAILIALKRCIEKAWAVLEPIKATLVEPTWLQLIAAAYAANVDLQFHGFVSSADAQSYDIFGVALCEAEVDVLTGEHNLLRVDILQDVGVSISPEIDIGQIEGAFMMGVGYHTCEKLVMDPEDGALLTNRSWDYHVMLARDIPQEMHITCRKSYSNDLILGSKAIGEPPSCLAVVVPIALRAAIVQARQENGIPTTEWFDIVGPFSTENICMAMKNNPDDFKIE